MSGQWVRLDVALENHLKYNLYPPVPEAFDAALAAVELAARQQSMEPCPYVNRADGSPVFVWEVVEKLHLDDIVVAVIDALVDGEDARSLGVLPGEELKA